MYDISELEPTGKEVATLILIVFALLLGAGFAGYCIGWERAEDVYCNGSGTESIGNEIGNAVGYPNQLHFSRAFKSIYGVSPRNWRKDNSVLKSSDAQD